MTSLTSMDRTYSLYETKARLSEVMRLVEDGAEVVVTVHGRKVARIVPYRDREGLGDRFERLVASGRLRAPKIVTGPIAKPAPYASAGALERFLADRD